MMMMMLMMMTMMVMIDDDDDDDDNENDFDRVSNTGWILGIDTARHHTSASALAKPG